MLIWVWAALGIGGYGHTYQTKKSYAFDEKSVFPMFLLWKKDISEKNTCDLLITRNTFRNTF